MKAHVNRHDCQHNQWLFPVTSFLDFFPSQTLLALRELMRQLCLRLRIS